MSKLLQLKRVICHMVVGPGEAERYLEQVLDRALYWADELHVVLDRKAGAKEEEVVRSRATSWQRSVLTWEDHEGRFRADAWGSMEMAVSPTVDDYIICLDADEVVFDHHLIRSGIKQNMGLRIPFRFFEMWGESEYRVDGQWRPYEAPICFPYREYGHFYNKALASGRQPTYVGQIRAAPVLGTVLHYGYARPEDRQAKYERYMRLDGGQFHDIGHLKSIMGPVSTEPWNKGGLLV